MEPLLCKDTGERSAFYNSVEKSITCIVIFWKLSLLDISRSFLLLTTSAGASDRRFYSNLTKGLTTKKHCWKYADPKKLCHCAGL